MKSKIQLSLVLTILSTVHSFSEDIDINHFKNLYASESKELSESLSIIEKGWDDSFAPMMIEAIRFAPWSENRGEIMQVLQKKTKADLNDGLDDLWQSVWSKPYKAHPQYAQFKADLYKHLDPRFEEYFDKNPKSIIRLDEIRWGGVARDGIPPLKNPKTLSVKDADYLDSSDVVFGVSVNGEARAYPKRILAWHEMVKDTVGGKSINGVYCTLCGSMIVYDTLHNNKHYELGTSGFLYRSNKLMYDHKTQSMWSTIEGKPVVGPLVGKGIQLKPMTVVTTTWGEWKKRHPETTVLSLDTGHTRDYGEGVAYNRYFSSDVLMFDIPKSLKDKSLKNKDSVLALRFGPEPNDKVAFSNHFLVKKPIVHYTHGKQKVVIITDKSGASRAYDSGAYTFDKWDQDISLTDKQGGVWKVTESSLTNADGKALFRFPSHDAFWFGWHSAYPETKLIK